MPEDDENDADYLHKIENLAILGSVENTKLSNSVFEAKRQKIIELDKEGAFIPLATRRIFLNYYVDDAYQNLNVWSKNERLKYKEEIQSCIDYYSQISVKKLSNEA